MLLHLTLPGGNPPFLTGLRAPSSRLRSSRPRLATFASIGFSTDPRVEIERAATGLLRDAAMLLVYQEVFRSPPAQAFFKLLLAFRRRDDSLKVFEAYGEFFKLMAIGQYQSWEDFVLEGILLGEGNPFAEAATEEDTQVPASLEAAAVSDLESLQRLSVTESTLSGWVAELVSDVKPEWRTAAASNLSCRTTHPIASHDEKKAPFGFTIPLESLEASQDKLIADVEMPECNMEMVPLETDAVVFEREKWRKRIGGLWKWSEAVPLLKQYHSEFGFGRASAAQVVKWKSGKLVPDFGYLKRGAAAIHVDIMSKQRSVLLESIKLHIDSQPAPHVLLHGPHGTGKSWLLSSTLSSMSNESSLRVMLLPGGDLKHIVWLLDEARKNCCLRFVLVIDDLFARGAEDGFLMLKGALVDEDWPTNVLLCATSTRSQVKVADKYVELDELFQVCTELSHLDKEQYLRCIDEMLEAKLRTRKPQMENTEQILQESAIQWGERHATLNVKHAAHFVESLQM